MGVGFEDFDGVFTKLPCGGITVVNVRRGKIAEQ
jgi:hypothetical protein